MQQTQGPLPGWEDPLEGEVQPTPVYLPRESHGQRGLVGYSPQGRKVRCRLGTKATTTNVIMGTPWLPRGQDSTLPVQETWVPRLVRELDPTRCSSEFKCSNPMPQLKEPTAKTEDSICPS